MLKDVMKNAVAFVDGRNYAGQCKTVTLPEVNLATEEMRAGGMDAPSQVDMGMEAMEASLEFLSVPAEVMKLFGKRDVALTLRGALASHDGTVKGATAEMRGKFKGQNPGEWEPGSAASFTATFAADYYRLTIDGQEIYEIDVDRMVRRVGGEDQTAELRNALGI